MLVGGGAARGVAIAVVALFLATVLSGCLGGDGISRSFRAVATPEWAPGYTWEWDVVVSQTGDFDGVDGQGSGAFEFSGIVRSEVHAVAATTTGRDVYIVAQKGVSPDGYPLDEHLRAVDVERLETLGRNAHADLECVDASPWHAVPPGRDLLSLLRFPLQAGSTYDMEWDGLEWDATVQGTERATVPAGAFDSVLISFEAGMLEEEDEYREEVTARLSVWYSAAAHNIVRAELEVRYEGQAEGEGSFAFTQGLTYALSELLLDTKEGPALSPIALPGAGSDGFHFVDTPSLRIATDTAFPLNSAETTPVATFWLEEYDPYEPGNDGMVVRDAPSPYELGADFEDHTVRWVIGQGRDSGKIADVLAEEHGSSLTVEFPLYGEFDVQAWLEPPASTTAESNTACATSGQSFDHYDGFAYRSRALSWPISEASVEVHYTRIYEVEVGMGSAARIQLDSLDVPSIRGEATTTTDTQSDWPLLSDAARVVFTAPNGDESDDMADLDAPGTWTVEWDTEGLAGTGIALGHKAQILLDVR